MSWQDEQDESRRRAEDFQRGLLDGGAVVWSRFRHSYDDEPGVLTYHHCAVRVVQLDLSLQWAAWQQGYVQREDEGVLWNQFVFGRVTELQPLRSYAAAFPWFLDWQPLPDEPVGLEALSGWASVLRTFEDADRMRSYRNG
jgi:hypothetical protein